MSIKRLLKTFVATGLTALVITALLVWWLILNQQTLVNAAAERFESYQLGQEVTITSDELTRLARTYVVTSDGQYRDQYWHLVGVLEGKTARPDSRTVAFDALLREKGFTAEELALLARANELSLALVNTEEHAFNIIEGKAAGSRDDAIKLVHDAAYHDAVTRIKAPVTQFQTLLDRRTQQDYQRLVDSTHSKVTGVLSLVLLVAGLLVASYIVFVRRITRPLDRLVKTTESVAAGDLSIKLMAEGSDEMAQVGRAFNTMVTHLAQLLSDLSRTGHELHAASTEVRRTMLKASEGVEQQHHLTQQVAAASTQLAATAREVSSNCAHAAEAGQHARDAAQAGTQVASNAEQHMQELEIKINTSRDELERLNKVMADVGNIISLIQDVADQTNLLALNAAIEAARAGEQGRGFAVVADEVRTLAKRTRESTGEVRARIKELLTGAENARGTMRESVAASEGMREKIGLVSEKLSSISLSVQNIRDQTTQIATAAEEQAYVSANVGQQIEIVSDFASQIERSTATTLQAVDALETLASQLIGRVGHFKNA
ncbi:MAG: methyl-accepting chemotaxis protein [Pseudomonadota bacterium]